MSTSATATLKPSNLLQRASGPIRSILANFRSQQLSSDDDDSYSPYFRPPGQPTSHLEKAMTTTGVEPSEDFNHWRTPHMPILTPNQLELALLEIRRRQKFYRKSASISLTPTREAAILVPLCTVQGVPSILFTRRSTKLTSHASQISFPGGYLDESMDKIYENEDNESVAVNDVDRRLVRTAIRETHEELRYDLNKFDIKCHFDYYYSKGDKNLEEEHLKLQIMQQSMNLPFVSILGQTQPVPSMSGSKVTPIIGTLNYDLPHFTSPAFSSIFRGNPDEVDWIFTLSICDLLSGETSEPLQKWGSQDLSSIKGKHEYWGPVFPAPNDVKKKDGDRIWGLTASILRPLLHKVFKPVFANSEM